MSITSSPLVIFYGQQTLLDGSGNDVRVPEVGNEFDVRIYAYKRRQMYNMFVNACHSYSTFQYSFTSVIGTRGKYGTLTLTSDTTNISQKQTVLMQKRKSTSACHTRANSRHPTLKTTLSN